MPSIRPSPRENCAKKRGGLLAIGAGPTDSAGATLPSTHTAARFLGGHAEQPRTEMAALQAQLAGALEAITSLDAVHVARVLRVLGHQGDKCVGGLGVGGRRALGLCVPCAVVATVS